MRASTCEAGWATIRVGVARKGRHRVTQDFLERHGLGPQGSGEGGHSWRVRVCVVAYSLWWPQAVALAATHN